MSVTIDDLLKLEHVRTLNLDSFRGTTFQGVSTDSRTVKDGDLFIALHGENFDGNVFAAIAFSRGAACAVIEERADLSAIVAKPLIIVQDGVKALGKLAHVYRKKFSIPLIAVAGSNGKTTTKEMIGKVLGSQFTVLSTQGNLNNHVGVPQTLFRLEKKHEIAVVEIGTNHFGELRYLCELTEPTHGVITNIGHEHMEFFKTLNGVAKAEGELFIVLRTPGLGFVNVDDRYVVAQARGLKNKYTYGFTGKRVDVKGKLLNMNSSGCFKFSITPRRKKPFNVHLEIPGKHIVQSALAAAAVGVSFGITPRNIQRALRTFTAVGKRMEVISVGGVKILNDTYNANPDSVLAALETLRLMKCKGKKIVVLADMLELGEAAAKEHRRVGKTVKVKGFQYLLTFGSMARYIHECADVNVRHHYSDKKNLMEFLEGIVKQNDIVLVKGSRGMKMEEVVSYLQHHISKTTL